MGKVLASYIDGGKQTFMVFSMLLLGISFILGICLSIDKTEIYATMSTLESIRSNYKLSGYLMILIFLLLALPLGYSTYLSSFFIISLPAFLIRKKLTLDPGVASEVTKQMAQLHPTINMRKMSMPQRYAYLYIKTTQNNDNISQTIRFAFTQVIFGRSMILVVLMCEYINIRTINSISLLVIMIASWVCGVLLYILSTLYLENLMSAAFIASNEDSSKIIL